LLVKASDLLLKSKRQLGNCAEALPRFDQAEVVSGRGHAVLINGEAGIGKSRLVLGLTEHAAEHHAWLTPLHGSPYHRDTALHPFIDLLKRTVLRSEGPDSTADAIRKLEGFLVQSGLPLDDEMPFFCALLSSPLPAEYAPSELGPDQRRIGR
jgi:hypothetical protein